MGRPELPANPADDRGARCAAALRPIGAGSPELDQCMRYSDIATERRTLMSNNWVTLSSITRRFS